MIAEKIRNASAALGVLAGQVTEDQWALLRCVKGELDDAAEQAGFMEEAAELALDEAIAGMHEAED